MALNVAERYGKEVEEMIKNCRQKSVITPENVYQPANEKNAVIFKKIVDHLMLPGSTILGAEHLAELHELSKSGKSCLILMEHFSNFDLPCFLSLVEKDLEDGKALADSVVAMAGMKLNEEQPLVLGFTEAFSRIVIYPSRSIASIKDPEERKAEQKKSNAINLAALKEMTKRKYKGQIILVFPAGTRYRPWAPGSDKGLKEIDSYIKAFENVVFISINGNTLRMNEGKEKMHEDIPTDDVMMFQVSPVIKTKDFRNKHLEECPEGEDSKQYVVDRIMDKLKTIHNEAEEIRQNVINS